MYTAENFHVSPAEESKKRNAMKLIIGKIHLSLEKLKAHSKFSYNFT